MPPTPCPLSSDAAVVVSTRRRGAIPGRPRRNARMEEGKRYIITSGGSRGGDDDDEKESEEEVEVVGLGLGLACESVRM
jgi:hypothetical protein